MRNEPRRTLVDRNELRDRLGDPAWAVLDARFDLADPGAGRRAYTEAHVPGAVYVDLDRDLSGPPLTDEGRHPLPSGDALGALFGRLGVDAHTQVVVYDQRDGATAARAWWLLRYMGHEAVAVLDGGWAAWQEAALPVAHGEERRPAAMFAGEPRASWLVTLEQVSAAPLLVDARDPDRFRGEREPLDPVAGHIPGAVNHPYRSNLDAHGRFLPPPELRRRLEATLAGVAPERAVFYCGSGVTACHDLLALCHAGLPPSRLYAGSWSEWCRDPGRPVATGEAAAG